MKKLFAIVVALIVACALIVAGCSSAAPATTAPPKTAAPSTTAAPTSAPPAPAAITLNFNTQTPGPGQKANYDTDEWIVKEMAARTSGRVKIQMFYNNGLASGTDGINATINGVTDINETVVGYYAGQFPLMSAAELPVGYPSSFAIANAANDYFNKYPQVQAEFSKVKLLYFAAPPAFVVGTSKVEIKTNTDAKGLTIRTHAGSKPIAEALGATAKIAPITETYEMISKGTVDGLIVAPEAFHGFKFDEVCKYMYDVSSVTSTSCSIIIMNKDSLAKLQPQDQQALVDVMKIALGARAVEWDKENTTGRDNFLKLPGRTFNTPSAADVAALKAAMKAPIDAWVQKANEKGAPGAEMLQYLQDRITYWSTQPLPTAPWVK